MSKLNKQASNPNKQPEVATKQGIEIVPEQIPMRGRQAVQDAMWHRPSTSKQAWLIICFPIDFYPAGLSFREQQLHQTRELTLRLPGLDVEKSHNEAYAMGEQTANALNEGRLLGCGETQLYTTATLKQALMRSDVRGYRGVGKMMR